MKIQIPPKLHPVFQPDHGAVRFRGAYGGRGSGKSRTFAIMALLRAIEAPRRIVCTRDLQVSIRESFYAELKAALEMFPEIARFFSVQRETIKGANGSEFIFRGLRANIESIKSLADIDIAIVEEAEDVQEESWRQLIPTIRAPGSEIWAIWNPKNENSGVDRRFRKEPHPRTVVACVNYQDNPWFPAVLEEERRHDAAVMDLSLYAHIWEGAYLVNSKAQILADKVSIREFEPVDGWDGPYHGCDFGFSQDPLAAVQVWIHDDRIWIRREAGGIGVELDEHEAVLCGGIPGIERFEVLCDNARPETVSYLRRKTKLKRAKSVDKWPGSVEDGITFIRSYREIVIHPECTETAKEARLYSYKVDRLSGQILDDIIDAHNHYIDALRYALQPIIRKRTLAVARVGTV